MKPCVVFCAAEFDRLLAPIPPDALVIAADGGLRHTDAIGVSPHVILGDFDSLGYVPQDARVFPVEKDDTDAMLAVRHGLAQGCDFFLFYGAMDGPRLDHTIANFQTLGFLSEHGATGVLVGRDYLATVISGQSVTFPAAAQGVISLFCLGSDAAGVTLEGLAISSDPRGAPRRIPPRGQQPLYRRSRPDPGGGGSGAGAVGSAQRAVPVGVTGYADL